MQKPLYRREEDPSIKNILFQENLLKQTQDLEDLLQKELTINRLNQDLLQKRITITKENLKKLSRQNPNYLSLETQLNMDRIELDELKIREKQLQRAGKNKF